MNLPAAFQTWRKLVPPALFPFSGKLAPDGERRMYRRFSNHFSGWLDIQDRRLKAEGLNLNRGGALVVADCPAEPDSVAFLYIESYQLLGWARVCWCTPVGRSQYRIGLEFRSPLMRADFGIWQFSRAVEVG
ncbi:MAG TPA: PilZ domain-containing protein [Bryobacteraceae bacterium]|nr:PilZ domain-containing protein [Bryobacteraceae bacterium]